LYQALATLAAPGPDDSLEAWQVFAEKLRGIMIAHRNIGHEWEFTREQLMQLTNYFQANRLLVGCLNLAYGSDREGIEESLLLPPAL
jgi:hypothetical protein